MHRSEVVPPSDRLLQLITVAGRDHIKRVTFTPEDSFLAFFSLGVKLLAHVGVQLSPDLVHNAQVLVDSSLWSRLGPTRVFRPRASEGPARMTAERSLFDYAYAAG